MSEKLYDSQQRELSPQAALVLRLSLGLENMISFVPGVYSAATARQEAGKGVAVVRTLRILWMTMVPYVPRRDDTFRETVSALPLVPSNSRNVSLLHFSATSFHSGHYHARVSLIISLNLENKLPINNDESRIPKRERKKE